jgi:hypothetical protein
MSLIAGTVTVNSGATFSGTGLAIGLMNAKVASYDPRASYTDPNPPHGPVTLPLASQLDVLNDYANEVNAIANAVQTWLAAGGYP